MKTEKQNIIRVGIGVVVQDASGRILLGKRNKAAAQAAIKFVANWDWSLPGGGLEYGESFEECAIREVKEETNLDIKNPIQLCIHNRIDSNAHWVTIGMKTTDYSGLLKANEPDVYTEWQWFALDELPQNIFIPSAEVIKKLKEESHNTKNKGTIILTASGTGKSTAAQTCEQVVDLDSIEYAFLYDKTLYGDLQIEELKNLINGWLANPGNYKEGSIYWNPECPDNYIKAISDNLEKGNTVLVPFIQEVYDLVQQAFGGNAVRKVIAFPEADNFGEYEQRYKERGNDENFIQVRRGEFDALAKLFGNAEGFEKIRIEKGKYLTEELISKGYAKKKASH